MHTATSSLHKVLFVLASLYFGFQPAHAQQKPTPVAAAKPLSDADQVRASKAMLAILATESQANRLREQMSQLEKQAEQQRAAFMTLQAELRKTSKASEEQSINLDLNWGEIPKPVASKK